MLHNPFDLRGRSHPSAEHSTSIWSLIGGLVFQYGSTYFPGIR